MADSSDNCPSTLSDLLFWCCLFLVPCTAFLSLFVWKTRRSQAILDLYIFQGSTTEAEVLSKECGKTEEFRGTQDAWVMVTSKNEREPPEYNIQPFYLIICYHFPQQLQQQKQITKKIKVTEDRYRNSHNGDFIEVHYLPGQNHSGVLLKDLKDSVQVHFSTVVFCWFLTLCAIAACATTAWCLRFGWPITLGTFALTYISTYVIVDRIDSFKERVGPGYDSWILDSSYDFCMDARKSSKQAEIC